jgi:ATPase subunit of ABC transporter with duplicated ATPase domains
MSSSLLLNNISLYYPHKICFAEFTTQIHPGQRIAIIGNNGVGKSCLLKIIHKLYEPTEGKVMHPQDVVFGYVPQVVEDFSNLSGGQRLNKALTQALAVQPNILLLDEPTNHLDLNNRKSIMRMLNAYHGTLIVASHDVELLRHCVDTIWHIDNAKVHIFSGRYDDYIREIKLKRISIEKDLVLLDRQRNNVHEELMKEQSRAKKSKLRGEKHIKQRKWPTVVSAAKVMRAVETGGRKQKAINDKKQALTEQLLQMRIPEVIKPKFILASGCQSSQTIVSISEGSCGYNHSILHNISLTVHGSERVAIRGDNGSGKSLLLKAIRGDQTITREGSWYVPESRDIGYLDQHYQTLDPNKTVIEEIIKVLPDHPYKEIRSHLNDFLFRKNEEVNALVSTLSGGEKARLSLAQIAAKPPALMLLDEITNNLDLLTREHMIAVLKEYPGAMIVISHDEDFLKQIGIETYYVVEKQRLLLI